MEQHRHENPKTNPYAAFCRKAARYAFSSAGHSAGFTLVEVLVVLTFSIVLVSLMLTSSRRLSSQGSLERSANRIAQDMRAAQAYALAADPTKLGSIFPPCGFGFHAPNPATGDPNSYIIYAKIPTASSVPCGAIAKQWTNTQECFTVLGVPATCPTPQYISTSTVRAFVLPETGKVQFSVPAALSDVYFEPPDPRTTVLTTNPGMGASSTASLADFKIELAGETTRTRIIRVANTGRIEIVGGEKLSKVCVPLNCTTIGGYVCGSWLDECGTTFSCGIGGACVTPGDACCLTGACPGPTDIGQCYPTPPTDPTNLSAYSISASQVNLAWTDTAINEQNFEIVRMQNDCTTVITTLNVLGTGLSTGPIFYSDTGLSADTPYCYKVRATNVTGPSGYTNTDTKLTRPFSPNIITANALSGPNRIFLEWISPGTPNITGFRLYRALGTCGAAPTTCGTYAEIIPPVGGPFAETDTIYHDNVQNPPVAGYIEANTSYCYKAISTNSAGDSVFSAEKKSSYSTDDVISPVPTWGTPAYTAVSAVRIDLAWNATSSGTCGGIPTGFTIWRCAGGSPCVPTSGTSINPGMSGAGAFIYSDTGVSNNTYGYCITANNSAGSSACSGSLYAGTLPAAPTLISVTSTGVAAAQAYWQDNTAVETNNILERANTTCITCACGAFVSANTAIGVVAGSGTQRTDADILVSPPLSPESFYCYRMQASNAGGSTFSNVRIAKTMLPAPTGLSAAAVGATVNLTWTDTDGTGTGFKIEQCAGAGCSSFTQIAVNTASPYSHTVSPLNTVYCYRIRATSAESDSAYSSTACATTLNAPGVFTATSTGLTAIQLSWSDNTTLETGYAVERGTLGGSCSGFALIATVGPFAGTGAYTDTVLAEQKYCYRIKAVSGSDASGYASTATAKSWLPVPTGLALSLAGNQVNLSWSGPSNTESGFKIERCQNSGCSDFQQIAIAGVNATTYADTAVSTDTVYRYRIRATSLEVDSLFTSTEEIAVLAPPVLVYATSTGFTAASVRWTDASTIETGYEIERSAGSGCSSGWVTTLSVGIVAGSGTTRTDADPTVLSAENLYCYRVKVLGIGGAANYSANRVLRTWLNAPTWGAPATTTGPGKKINLFWNDNSFNNAGYKIEYCTPNNGCTNWVANYYYTTSQTSYTDNVGNNPGGTYFCYRLRASAPEVDSAYSAAACQLAP